MIRLSVIAVSLLLTTEVVEQRWLKNTGVYVTGEVGCELASESEGATITFIDNQQQIRRACISQGSFSMSGLPVGRYDVTITSSRGELWKTSVDVTANSTVFWFEKRGAMRIALCP